MRTAESRREMESENGGINSKNGLIFVRALADRVRQSGMVQQMMAVHFVVK